MRAREWGEGVEGEGEGERASPVDTTLNMEPNMGLELTVLRW